jgi:hypothetical protein
MTAFFKATIAPTLESFEAYATLELSTADEVIPVAAATIRPPPSGPRPAIGTLSVVLGADGIGGRLVTLPPEENKET